MQYRYTGMSTRRGKKSENCLCALPRLAKPVEHVSWGFGILDALRVNLKHMVKII